MISPLPLHSPTVGFGIIGARQKNKKENKKTRFISIQHKDVKAIDFLSNFN
jgi:hypothetical protein